MNQPYNNQQQSRPHTQHNNVGYNSEPTINFSTESVSNHINVDEQRWRHFLTNISRSVTKRLTFIGVFYLLVGILSIGLELHLLFNGSAGYVVGFVNGFILCFVGILTLILCHQQVYVLTSLFVLVSFQLLVTISTFVIYSYVLYLVSYDRRDCSDCTSSSCCGEYTAIISILIGDLVHLFITFCIIIINLVIITNARRLPNTLVRSSYIASNAHTQSTPVSFQNLSVTAINK